MTIKEMFTNPHKDDCACFEESGNTPCDCGAVPSVEEQQKKARVTFSALYDLLTSEELEKQLSSDTQDKLDLILEPFRQAFWSVVPQSEEHKAWARSDFPVPPPQEK